MEDEDGERINGRCFLKQMLISYRSLLCFRRGLIVNSRIKTNTLYHRHLVNGD